MTIDAPPSRPREIELALGLARDAMPALIRHPAIVAATRGRARTSRLVSAYYDTPKGELAAAGIALRVRRDGKRYVQTVKGPPEAGSTPALRNRAEYEWTLRRPAIDATSLRSTPWAKRLQRAQRRGLTRRFTTDFTRRTTPLAFADGTRALLCLDVGSIRAPSTRRRVPISEIEIELVDGAPARLYELARELANDLPVSIVVANKAERGFALVSAARPSPVHARDATIAADARAIDALATIAGECLHQIAANAPGVVAYADPEWVHQMRVGTRRLRACLKLVARVDASAPTEPVALELKWLAGMLGTARDLDVFATETLPEITNGVRDDVGKSAALRKLSRRVAARRGIARRAVRAAINSPRYARLVLAVATLIEGLDGGAAPRSARSAARVLLARRHRSLQRLAARLDGAGADERHAVRIAAKKLRYAAEFFAPLCKRRRVRRYLGALARLQQVLGQANDEIVATRCADETGPSDAAIVVRAHAAANAPVHALAFSRAWKRFERAKPYWHPRTHG